MRKNHELSKEGTHDETSNGPVLFKIQTTGEIEHDVKVAFVPPESDFAISVLDANDETDHAAVETVQSDSLSEIQTTDESDNDLFNMEFLAAETTGESQIVPSTAQINEGIHALSITQTHFKRPQ